MATPNYEVDLNDKRLTAVTEEEKLEINKSDATYQGMIDDSNKFYQDQINAAKDYAETQKQNQQAQTDFAIDQIEQQKQQAHKDYLKEQSASYVDWQKQSNQYGANAEQWAASGLAGSGYSESSLVSMYNTYQNRVATARESYNTAVLNYNNAIKDAQLQNNAALAEIAYNALQAQLELSLEGFQYKNQLIAEQANKKLQLKTFYQSKYTDVLSQINAENSLNEQARQADMANARQQEQIKIAQAELKLAQDKFAYEKEQDAKAATIQKSSSGGGSSSGSKSSSSSSSGKVSGNSSKAKGDSTYNSAAEEMKKSGAISAGDGGLMTKTEWTRRKKSGSNRAETSYATYEDYVNSFTAWRKANPEK